MPGPRRFSATLPERDRPSFRARMLRLVLLVLATLALTRVAWWAFRVPVEPVRAERIIPLR
jgi:hypothetical protein